MSDYELIFRFRLSALIALSHSLADYKVSLGTYNCRKTFRDLAKSFQRGFACVTLRVLARLECRYRRRV